MGLEDVGRTGFLLCWTAGNRLELVTKLDVWSWTSRVRIKLLKAKEVCVFCCTVNTGTIETGGEVNSADSIFLW